jgi:hypothetical protein
MVSIAGMVRWRGTMTYLRGEYAREAHERDV